MLFKYVVDYVKLMINECNKVLHLINYPLNIINYDFQIYMKSIISYNHPNYVQNITILNIEIYAISINHGLPLNTHLKIMMNNI